MACTAYVLKTPFNHDFFFLTLTVHVSILMTSFSRWLEGVENHAVRLVEEALKKKQDLFMPFTRSGGYLPDPAAVSALQDMIQDEGYRYFRPLRIVPSNLPKARRLGNLHMPEKENILSVSEPTHVPPTESLPASSVITATIVTAPSDRQSALELGGRAGRQPLTLPSGPSDQGLHTSHRLKNRSFLMETTSEGAKDNSLSVRKASWGQVFSTTDSILPSNDQDSATATTGISKPTLRDILEQEELVQKHGQANISKSPAPATVGIPAQRASKLSQKERRKQLQQQASSSMLDQGDTLASSPAPQAWAKVSRTALHDLTSIGSESSELTSKSSVASKTSTAPPTLSLLDLQQSELALLRLQPKEVPRIAIATSKPVKETM
jgi:hypothetical protein